MASRLKRHKRIRKKIFGSPEKPRLSVYRSSKHLQAQLINDVNRKTILGMSTIKIISEKKTKIEEAKDLGLDFGKKILAVEKGRYSSIVFDRGGYRYHGRIKAFAEGLREAGLKF
jgi:large subunit ribosomal protein L18